MKTSNPKSLHAWSASLADTIARPALLVVMGVSGSGKTTIAAVLAAVLGCSFQEGDELHPQENIEKMHSGIPLTDADRLPWLKNIANVIDEWRERHDSGVVSCSALKRSYRDIIRSGHPDVTFVYLKGSFDLIRRRMVSRHEHFMPVSLLESQFATLEAPAPDERPVTVDIGGSPAEIVDAILEQLENPR